MCDLRIGCGIRTFEYWAIEILDHFRGTRVAMVLRMTMADDRQKRAEDFADLSITFVVGLPHTLIAQRLGGQYLDASTSVAANYRSDMTATASNSQILKSKFSN